MEEIIEKLKDKISTAIDIDDPSTYDTCIWEDKIGVLISVNDARQILALLKLMKSSKLIIN